MEDENETLIEDDIVRSISLNGGISGTTAVLVGAENHFDNITLKKNRFKIRTRTQETQEL